jgi:hypothetical protein
MLKTLIAGAVLATAVAATAVAAPLQSSAQPNNGPVSGHVQGDTAFGSDMSVVHELLGGHSKIKRSVTNLPNGIRTVTESDDAQVVKEIKDHVASMDRRLKEGRVFNVASHNLPTIFANNAKLHTEIQQTPRGVIFTQTSNDSATVAALQAHAGEVSDLAREGAPALMRAMMANGGVMAKGEHMGMRMMAGGGGPMNGSGPMMAQMMQQMMQGSGMGNMRGDSTVMPGQDRGQSQSPPPSQTRQ